MRVFSLLIALIAFVLAVVAQRGETDDFLVQMNKEISRNGGPRKSVSELAFTTVFPTAKDSQFVSGEPAEVVVGVTNLASHPTSVFAISGYFANPKNASKSILDLGAQRFSIKLGSNEQASFPLRFTPELEAQNLILVVYIDFFDIEETPIRAIAFEGPIEITPADALLDFAGLSILLVIGGLSYVGYKIATNKPVISSASVSGSSGSAATAAKKPKVPAAEIREQIAAKKEVLDEEWIPAHLKKSDSKKQKK